MIYELERMQKILNAKSVCPRKGYRRDVPIYELVCYVNNITGCYLSGNLEPIKIFIERARIYIEDNVENEGDEGYFDLVEKYLVLMGEYINRHSI
ncbi:hypothetical protein EZI54_23860 [Marinobacter halodurans]|uniref:Uncharacterized protein n=1 Tax=Marinobacter halodurans TaxID=2528979 RepID=A0ABY1ZD18_9GAMM|nr:hypothetical protein [Marinobacter halodurans]TBW44113.1 hypothetical protein EZI54_23860 [Marinobacter halodurans]